MLEKVLSKTLDILTSELLLKFLVALLVTIRLNIYVNETRGYAAIGGEPLLIPLVAGVHYLTKELKKDIKKANKDRESLKANQNKPKLSLSKNGGNING